jgi:hypothetical protein
MPRIACFTLHRAARGVAGWLLPYVQSCPPYRNPAQNRCLGAGLQRSARSICRLLEYRPQLKRPRVARKTLFLPTRSAYLKEALRYTELNLVRAGLVDDAECWPWSSAPLHCSQRTEDGLLTMEPWRNQWSIQTWREYLRAGEEQSNLTAIRRSIYTGRPLGRRNSSGHWRRRHVGVWHRKRGGRPKKQLGNGVQCGFQFDAQ